jgi:hypothetical protein
VSVVCVATCRWCACVRELVDMSGQAATAASDWRVEHSQKLNKPYYYNVRTKESRWSPPPGLAPPPRVGAATATSQPQNLVVSATTSQNAPSSASVHAVPHKATVTFVAAAAAAGTDSRDAASHEITDHGGVVLHAAHAQQTAAVGNTRPTSTASHDDSSRPSTEHPPKARASLKPIVIRAAQFVSAEDDDTSSVVGGAAAAEVGEAGRKTYIANIG